VTKKILSTEDSDLFREAVGKVSPLKNDKVHGLGAPRPKPFPKPRPPVHEVADEVLALVGTEDDISYVSGRVAKNSLAKLRQGYFAPQAELDLHGLNSAAAHRELLGFLADAVRARYRCVHIVHGKGYRSQENYPILKNKINLWLRQHPDVLAFCSAPPKDGGAGAVYVLLAMA
jgi:DNA-nicking Smr family endonuclease